MSDFPLPHAAEAPDSAAADSHTQSLKRAREQAGLHVVALAAMLKVPVNKLEALEAGRYSDLPDMTFARALAKSVCRQLKIDPTPILAGLPQNTPVDLGHLPKGLNTTMPNPSHRVVKAVVGGQLPWPAAAATLLVVVAGVLWWALPAQTLTTDLSTPADVGRAAPAPVAPEGQTLVSTAVVVPPAALPATPTLSPSPAPPPSAVAPVLPAQNTVAPPKAPVAPAPADPPAVLQLRASQTAWVEVVGRSGKLLIQRTLQAGETVAFAEDAPYAVVTGRADATEVLVRGQTLDLGPLARNNVARFSAP